MNAQSDNHSDFTLDRNAIMAITVPFVGIVASDGVISWMLSFRLGGLYSVGASFLVRDARQQEIYCGSQ